MTTKTIKTGDLYRSITLKREEVQEESRTIEVSFSSEEPVDRWFGQEILDHGPGSVRLGRLNTKGPVLVDHDPRDHVGVIESVNIDSTTRKGRAALRFGKGERADEVFNDIKDGIRANVSVGYRIHKVLLEEINEDEEIYRAVDWEPFEISIVSVPADISVGVNRSSGDFETQIEIKEGNRKMTIKKDDDLLDVDKKSAPTEPKKTDVRAGSDDNAAKERHRCAKIAEVGSKFAAHGGLELANDFIASGRSVEEFQSAILERASTAKPEDMETGATPTSLDLTEKETRNFSLMRGIRALVTHNWKHAGFERECSIAIQEKLGREARGFFVPAEIQSRTMKVSDTLNGGALVGTDHLSGSFIDYLYAASVLQTAGATMLPGLVGDVDIPKQAGAVTFYWVDEDGDGTDSDVATGSVILSPKTVAGSVKMTRRLIKQSAPSVEALIQRSLGVGAGLAIDKAGLQGIGDNQPGGIYGKTGVNTQTVASAGDPTWAETVGFETNVDADNALMGSLGYITTPTVRGNMKVKAKDSGSGRFVAENNEANGYNVWATSQLDANRIIFGNFSDVYIGMWGVLDIVADLATEAASAGVVMRAFQDVDVNVGHVESFCINA